MKHLGAPCLRLGGDIWSSVAPFQDSFALGLRAPESQDDFELSAVQFSGLPGNDRPLTHTVTLHPARSLVLARWRHSISFEVRRCLPCHSPGGAACSLKLRQVQHSKYRPPRQYSNRRFG